MCRGCCSEFESPKAGTMRISKTPLVVFTNASVISGNGLLAALEPFDFALLHPHLRQLPLIAGATLQDEEAPVEQIYFPLSGLISLVAVMEAGEAVETATIGRRGRSGRSQGWGIGTLSPAPSCKSPVPRW